jgi:hypothetical protein
MTNFNSSFQRYNAWSRYKNPTTRAWQTTGNTDVVSEPAISANSMLNIQNTSQFNGPWWYTLNPGVGFTITSNNSETATTTTYSYTIE